MANATVSRLGQVNTSGDVNALFLKVFSGEVLATFQRENQMLNMTSVRQISSGKSAQFPVIGTTSSGYHTPGNEITGSSIKHAEKTINIDDLLLSSAFLSNLDEAKKFDAKIDASANTPRPLVFNPKIQLTNKKGTGFDVGKSVTDITVTADGKETYLSLKTGGTTTFFNVGVRRILTPTEIRNGKITNKDGLKLLNLFSIDPKRFTTIFNSDIKTQSGKVSVRPKNAMLLRTLLESGIGFGYHVVHQKGKNVFHKQMDSKTMKKAAITGNMTIFYGGKTGKGKRIDIEMESPLYKFKLNIRDTQGNDGYPTRLMCDFKDKI